MSEKNCTSTERVWAPRGRIFDRNEKVLVSNRMVYGVNLEPYELRQEELRNLVNNVSKISNESYREIFARLHPQIYISEKPAAEDDSAGETGGEELERILTLVSSYYSEQGEKFSASSLKLDLLLYGLSQVLEVDYLELDQMVDRDNMGLEPVRIYNHLSAKELVQIEAALPYLPAVKVEKAPMREYIYDTLAAHVLGYLGMMDEEDWSTFQDYGYNLNELIGQMGLEREYELELHPISGKKVVMVNSQGVQIGDESVKVLTEPQPGADLVLNLDYKLQKKAEELLAGQIKKIREAYLEDPEDIAGFPRGGAVVVLKPDSGQVLALASYPAFDPNVFIDMKRREERLQLFTNKYQPMINRAIFSPGSKGVEPGSIFKIVTATAALEELGITLNTIVNDRAGQKVYYDPERP
ncbi:MAG: penicillin-binding transpeptidase domain-containing protein, partial [Halanaerobium sp.]|nr:penicillin-binding transpeptidase domain-containing protein [Halanaerobium sp.]